MRRVLCVWLPNWAITRAKLERGFSQPDKPFVLVDNVKGVRIVCAANDAATHKGIRAGHKLSDAKALIPDVSVMDADAEGDLAGLTKLMAFAQRFSPSVAIDPPDGLWLDITGCAHLFGGEAELAGSLVAALTRRGIEARAAVADTFGAAWAFARGGSTIRIVKPGAHPSDLATLPVALLRPPNDDLAKLRQLGLRTIGQVAALPRAGLGKRFAQALSNLDKAMGSAPEAIRFHIAPTPWVDRVAFAEPISTPEDLARALAKGLDLLTARLAAARHGGRRFVAQFHRVDEGVEAIAAVSALPSRDGPRLAKLLGAKLERVNPGFGIEALTVIAERVEPLAEVQAELGGQASHEASLAAFVDSLGNRLGHDRIWRATPYRSYWPERAIRRVSPLTPVLDGPWRTGREWPVRLLLRPEAIEVMAPLPDHPPLSFRWRKVLRRVERAEGPERIEPEWWREDASAREKARDYYRVEDNAGARFWIYRSGHYAEADPPGWYLHGIFA